MTESEFSPSPERPEGVRGPSRIARLLSLPLVLALLLALIPLGASASPSLAAPALPGGAVRGASLGGVTEYRFPNGLTALILSDYSKPTITVNAVYRVGSAMEENGQKGLAHLLEHLLFKGTPSHPDIPREIAARGGRANGTTWTDRTNYFEILPAGEENLDWALSLEAERMTRATFTPEQLERERGVVLNEMERGENDPTSSLIDRMVSVAYDWHPYADSTIGNPDVLRGVTYEDVRSFYRDHMRPDLATVVVAGAVDEGRALERVAHYFAPIPRPSAPLPAVRTGEQGQDGPRSVSLSRRGEVQTVALLYHVPAAGASDSAAPDLLAGVLGDEPSGRLYRNLVEKGLASAVSVWPAGFRDPSFLLVLAQVPVGRSLDAAQAALIGTVEGLGANPPSPQELDRARTKIERGMDLEFAFPESFAVGLAEWIARGDWRLFFLQRDRIAAATPEDLARFARRYLVAENRTLGRFVPVESPTRVRVAAAAPLEAVLRDFAPRVTPRLGASFDVSCAALDRATIRPADAGGVRMAFLPKKTRGGLVTVRIALRFGSLGSLRGWGIAPDLAGALLRRGTTKRDRAEVDAAFDRLGATVFLDGGSTGAQAGILVPEEHLEEALALTAECLRSPAFDPAEFETLRRETLASLEQELGEPESLADDWLEGRLSPYPSGDVRHHDSLRERLALVRSARVEDVRAFHAAFYGASDALVSAVGQFDPERLRTVIGRLFGDWRSPAPYERVAEPFAPIPPAETLIPVRDKPNAVMEAVAPVRLRSDDPDVPALRVAATILGGGWLDSRLSVRIRQTEGTSYHVGMGISIPDQDDSARWSFSAIAAPENLERVKRAFYEELDRALAKGFTAEETERAKAYLLSSGKVDRAQDSALAGMLQANLRLGRTFAWTGDQEARLAAVTPEAAWAALKRHLDPRGFSLAVAGDLKP